LECHLAERRLGKVGGHKWTMNPDAVKKVLETGDTYINPGWKIRTGWISIGTHRNWLYSKKLFPEPAELHHQLVRLMKSIIT